MKRVIVSSILFVFYFSVSAAEKTSWILINQPVKEIFECQVKDKKTEIMRLYANGTYEHLLYETKNYSGQRVDRNLGKYHFDKNKIVFDKPEFTNFKGKFIVGAYYYDKGKLYQRFLDRYVFKKNYVYKSTSKKEYKKPFYIQLENDLIVTNAEAKEQLDIHHFLGYLFQNAKGEQDKIDALTKFIVQTVEYDHEGLNSDKYVNRQDDVRAIIAGQQRKAVCAGYAHVFTELCKMAGLEARSVSGYTRQNHSDLKRLTGYHAWNIVYANKKPMIYDVTWADNGNYVESKWIDVDPGIMVYSHFPSDPMDQLLDKPMTEEEFLHAPLITTSCSKVKMPGFRFNAYIYCSDNLQIALAGIHTIKVAAYPKEFQNLVYRTETQSDSKNYYSILDVTDCKVSHQKDSTYIRIPLSESLNLLTISVDNCLTIKCVAAKGGKDGMMKHYLSLANTKHADAYVKAVVAALYLKDYVKLKSLVGCNANVFFDKKGKMKMDKKYLERIKNWDGELSSLTMVTSYSYKTELIKEGTSMYIEIPDGPRFILEKNNDAYCISAIE